MIGPTMQAVLAVILELIKAAAAVGSALVIFSFKSRDVRRAAIPPAHSDSDHFVIESNTQEIQSLRKGHDANVTALGKGNARFISLSARVEALERWRSDVKDKLSDDAGGWQRAIWEIEQMKKFAEDRERRLTGLEERFNRRVDADL